MFAKNDDSVDQSNHASEKLLHLGSKNRNQMAKFYVQLSPKGDNRVDHSNFAFEKLLHLRSGNWSHMTDVYVQFLQKIDSCVDQSNLVAEKLAHQRSGHVDILLSVDCNFRPEFAILLTTQIVHLRSCASEERKMKPFG